MLPCEPQALCCMPDWHLPALSQQPVEQVLESQAGPPQDTSEAEKPRTAPRSSQRSLIIWAAPLSSFRTNCPIPHAQWAMVQPVRFTLQKGVQAGLVASPPDLRALGEAVVAGPAHSLDAQAVALVLGRSDETDSALLELTASEPVRALALTLRMVPLGLRFALVNGSVVRVLERVPRKLTSQLPGPKLWLALRRGFDAAPMLRAEALAPVLTALPADPRVRACLAFVFPHAPLWSDADAEQLVDAPELLLLALLRDVPGIASAPTWPPPERTFAALDDARLEQVRRVLHLEGAERVQSKRAAVREAERDVLPLLDALAEHADVLLELVPTPALLEQVKDLQPLEPPVLRALRDALVRGWARELTWDGPPRTAPWSSPWQRGAQRLPAPKPPAGPRFEAGRWERTFRPTPVPPQLEDVWRRLEQREDVDVWGLAAILPLGPRVLPRLRALARKDPTLIAALQDIDDGGLDEALLLAWDSRRRQLALAAREFARRFPSRAAHAAVRLCFSELEPERRLGLQVLRFVGDAANPALDALDEPQRGWMERLRESRPRLPARAPKLPPFLRVAALPPVVTLDGAEALSLDAVTELVGVLKRTPPEDASALRELVRGFTPDSLGELAAALFRTWALANAPPKEKWMLHALAHFPSDEWARGLSALLSAWAANRAWSRVQDALAVLGRMGTTTSLRELQGLMHEGKGRALTSRARLAFEEAAVRMQLGVGELEDRLFPQVVVPAGHRLSLEQLRLHLSLEGREVPLSAALKSAERELPRMAARLERLMCEGAPLEAVHFTEVWMMSPVLRLVAERLVWDAFRGPQRVGRFVPGDGTVLAADVRVRPTHAIELSAGERATYLAQLGAQPFAQLGREVHPLDRLEGRRQQYVGRVFSVWQVLALERHGWERAPAMQGDLSFSLTRRGLGWSASVSVEPGISFSNPGAEPGQALTDLGVESSFPLTQRIASELQRDLLACLGA